MVALKFTQKCLYQPHYFPSITFSVVFFLNIWSLTLLYLVFVLDLRKKKESLGKQVRKLMVGSDFIIKNYGF
jgi:hypothetical protein